MPRQRWNDIEERIDANRRRPSLEDAALQYLPDGIVLLTPRPQATVLRGLVRQVFVLGFMCRDKHIVTHVEEHCEEMPADVQLRWAVERFESHLKAAQLV